jgi:hypothetical protein
MLKGYAMSSKIEEFDRIFTYHAPPDEEAIKAYKAIRAKAKELAMLVYELTPASREQSLSFTKIEEAVMWANAAIARWPELRSLVGKD